MPSRETKNPHSVEDLENRGGVIKGELLHSTITAVSIPLQENLLHTHTKYDSKLLIPLWSTAAIYS